MQNSKSIGNKIVTARKKINLSQAELARQVSISSQAVGKWERGESMPDITTLSRLAEILGTDLNYFSESFASEQTALTAPLSLDKQSVEVSQKKKPSWDMSNGNWVNADFSGLRNLQEKFNSSNMKACKFVGSELSGLQLKNNNIENCDFSDSIIKESHFCNTSLCNNNFMGCSLEGSEFSGNSILNCNFSDADFSGAVIKSCSFSKSKFENAILKETIFKTTGIDGIVFNGVIEDCTFENCGFSKVTFQNAKLINTFFKTNKNLKRISFINCEADRMTYEFLKSGKADLSGISIILS